MCMSTKNVYVSESDLPLFDRAAELAGGMSAAVVLGLRLYVAQQDRQRKGTEMKTIELEVDDGAVAGVKRFSGRQILRWSRQEGLRSRTARVYETARGQYAVYLREDPNWTALSGPDDDNPGWGVVETRSARAEGLRHHRGDGRRTARRPGRGDQERGGPPRRRGPRHLRPSSAAPGPVRRDRRCRRRGLAPSAKILLRMI